VAAVVLQPVVAVVAAQSLVAVAVCSPQAQAVVAQQTECPAPQDKMVAALVEPAAVFPPEH
jgi:hypothetical protein